MQAKKEAKHNIFIGYAVILLLCIGAAVWANSAISLLLPPALLIIYQGLVDYSKLYYLLFALIPLSTEVYFGGFGTDFPTEFLIIGFCLVYILQTLLKPKTVSGAFLCHPITSLLLAQLFWIAITTLTSSVVLISVKYFIAKIWYITTFYLFLDHFLSSRKIINRLLMLCTVSLAFATLKVILHHGVLDFGFTTINPAVVPFFRNHVNYAAFLVLFLPYVGYLFHVKRSSKRWQYFLGSVILLLIVGIFLSYTRAAYIALFAIAPVYFVVRWRLMRLALVGSVLGVGLLLFYLIGQDKYLDMIPSEKTVAHQDFEGIVSSTTKLEDVSTMERYYRWVAGVRMFAEKPLVGHGPGNFYSQYKKHTLERFSTYVSDNPERSGVHCYYLMLALEQGLIGVLLFISMVFYVLLLGERLYHKLKGDDKVLVLAAILCLIIISLISLINDLIETDKIGSFFFVSIGIIVWLDLKNKKEEAIENENLAATD